MDVAFINPFILGANDVFDTMLQLPLKLGKPYLKHPTDRMHKLYRISAQIGLSGAARGLLVMNLPEPLALRLAEKLLDKQMDRIDGDAKDALSEVANMIAGSAKKHLPGGQVKLSMPSVVSTYSVRFPDAVPVIGIPFDTAAGRFVLEVMLVGSKSTPASPSAASATSDTSQAEPAHGPA